MAKAAPKEVQRLDKIVSHLTGLSRQNATRLIKEGEVFVDDEAIVNAATKVNINSNIVIVGFNDDEEEQLKASEAFKKRVFMLNKPNNFVCADRDKNRSTVQSLFRNELNIEDLHCAGRLDVDTTGLIIVTDDGDLNHEITSPKKSVDKVYLARLDQAVPESAIKSFATGIKHPEEKKRYLPAKLTILDYQDQFWAAVQLSEGRYHEVKRLFEMVGCTVQELVRVAIGSLCLNEDQVLGAYVPLDEDEVAALFTNHDYEQEELIVLLERYLSHIKHSRLAYLPERYAQEARADMSEELSASREEENFDELDEDGELRIY